MNKSEIRAIFKKDIPILKKAMRLDTWNITLEFVEFSNASRAEISYLKEYEAARIELDSSKVENRADLISCIRHELIHLLTPDLTRAKVRLGEILSSEAFEFVEQIMYGAGEYSVRKIENMLDNIGMTPAKMVQRGRKL